MSIDYELLNQSHVSLRIYDISGRLVDQLLEGEKSQGIHHISYDRKNLPNGVYFIELEAGEHTTTKKITVIK